LLGQGAAEAALPPEELVGQAVSEVDDVEVATLVGAKVEIFVEREARGGRDVLGEVVVQRDSGRD